MRPSIRLLPGLLSIIAFVACGEPAGETTNDGVCDVNPEPRLAPKGTNLNGSNRNGASLQGSHLNRADFQGYMNGQDLQGVELQGTNLNGSNLNGLHLNGAHIGNGTSFAAANELVATKDGALVSGDVLVGAKLAGVLSDGRTVELTIAAFERSAAGDVAYYRLDHEGQSICGAGERGMFLAGVWDERATRHDELSVGGHRISASFSCESGALAKCVAWGYAPWSVGPELHQTCTRMTRADYCGSGVSFTKDATLIDVYDVRGVQTATDDASMLFEAGWGPNGAVCVGRTRFNARTADGADVLPSCWSALPKCASFEDAQSKGAMIGNSSRIQSRTLCSPPK